jgi:hypothetical protein
LRGSPAEFVGTVSIKCKKKKKKKIKGWYIATKEMDSVMAPV